MCAIRSLATNSSLLLFSGYAMTLQRERQNKVAHKEIICPISILGTHKPISIYSSVNERKHKKSSVQERYKPVYSVSHLQPSVLGAKGVSLACQGTPHGI